MSEGSGELGSWSLAFQLGTIEFLIKELLPRVPQRGNVLSLSRQFITTSPGDVRLFLNRHGLNGPVAGYDWTRPVTSRELFLAFGFSDYQDIDFTPDEGCTIIHDLNRPVPPELHSRFDLVMEMGTLEHIFDVRTVLESMVRMVKPGGTVFHFSPLTWINHGFYNFSLTLFYDSYRVNGFTDFAFYIVAFPRNFQADQTISYEKVPFVPHQFGVRAPDGTELIVSFMARKERNVETFQIPIQAAYDPALRVSSPLKQWG